MSSFPPPQHFFAAADENDNFVISVINLQLNQFFKKTSMLLIWVFRQPDYEYEDKQIFLKISRF